MARVGTTGIGMKKAQTASCLVAAMVLVAAAAEPAQGGPQHWGYGFSYLAAIEEADGGRRLVVYEPPMFAQDCTWPSRWLDRTTVLSDVPAGGMAIGDYWPGSFGREYLTTVRLTGGSLVVSVYEPPEYFTTDAWALKSTSTGVAVAGTLLGATAGDLRNLNKDQLLVAMQDGAAIKIAILTPPSTAAGTSWTKLEGTLPGVVGSYLGVACGNFWGDGTDTLALATQSGGQTHVAFYQYSGGSFSLLVSDAAADLPLIQNNGLAAADFEKDGFDALTLITSTGDFEVRVAPARPGDTYNPGPEYDGFSYAGQPLPGNGRTASLVAMTGSFSATASSRLAFGAGRVFGYIETDLNSRYAIAGGADAQIAFASRSPRKDERLPYGWPALGETVTYTINLNNNGSTVISGNQVRLKVWVNRPNRNADTDPVSADAPDYNMLISDSLPTYNASSPTYVQRAVTLSWPYSLVPAGAGATWSRLNVHDVGERWVIAVIEYAGDANRRNNRYEMALHGLTFHPIFRTQSSLADRQPTVQGDPPSKEYLSRKLADTVQCMWERSKTQAWEPVLQRLWFDSYEIGWPHDQPDPGAAWQIVQAKYEGWRELDGWWGVYQGWERFNWGDGGAELHETGHLFHPVGDLYQYTVWPTFTGAASMADGSPVQIATWMWPVDSYGSGHTRITWPACEMMRRHLVGSRNNHIEQWWTLISDRTFVRVLDRNGDPVPNAQVTLWENGSGTPVGSGVTQADGRWETTSLWGSPTTDAFGRKHYNNACAGTAIYTVKIGEDYVDAEVMGTETTGAHSQYTRMGHSLTDQAEWTWDFHTHYLPAAAAPDFAVTAAVQGRTAKLGIEGSAGGTYRLYRRWEPAHIRTYLGEYTAAGTTLTLTEDLGEADSYGSNRFRARYDVTRVNGDSESLPRTVQISGLGSVRGIAPAVDGKLLVAANTGIANPFCQLFDGTTPYRDLFYHFRFGHTANRVVASQVTPGQYYVTLSFSDMTPEYLFDLVTPPTGSTTAYDVRNEISGGWIAEYSASSPYTVRFNTADEAQRFQPGDQINGSAGSARVLSVAGDTLAVDALAFSGSEHGYNGTRLAGTPGSNAALRELQSPRGLDTLRVGDAEYVAIADTGNRRVAIWTDRTAYVTHWQTADTAARPAAIAANPTQPNAFYMLDRRTNGVSWLYLFHFDGSSLSVEPGYPVVVTVSDYTNNVTELGLAAAMDPATCAPALLVTDAKNNRVVELTRFGTAWQTSSAYTQATGVFAGNAALSRPSDVAYVAEGRSLKRYVVDGSNRVALVSTAPLANPDCNGNGVADAADITQGTSLDCNANGTPDECEVAVYPEARDCNGNGIPDDCDIDAGLETDCNTNDIPDECELAAGQAADCNNNAIPDECDLASGAGQDCNANAILDECELVTQAGLLAHYFPTRYLTGTPVEQVDATVDFDWGTGSPVPGIGVDQFSVRWSGTVRTPSAAGTYTFSTLTDDGIRLWVNDTLIIDQWIDQGPTEWSGTIALAADTEYPIVMEYYENGGGAVARLYWQPPAQARTIIPAEALHHEGDNDCNVNGVPDECDLAGGFSEDENDNGLPDECEADCNGNGVPDPQDIAQGTSEDCNDNRIPDECELAGGVVTVASFLLDADPGWTTEGLWAFGQPTGQGGGGAGGGRPDPTGGYTGSFVYGYNLNGNYEENLPERHLTSTAIDCTGVTDVTLSFWRYLGVEAPDFDRASVYVSHNGTSWSRVWQNADEVSDSTWVPQEIDISSVADNQPTVYLRWTMGPTDESVVFCGWNLDDIIVRGNASGGGDANGNGILDECEQPGDCDFDGDVDEADYVGLSDCLLGPLGGLGTGCECYDINADGHVDLADFAEFQAAYGGT
ncbi:MAG: hypothetical protein JXB13_03455 [Phycisphaerae bacterium]|nr:hypothetical protein [Phycisphaerae bacterium]